MAEKILNTRFQMKYDTLTNWVNNNPILKAGEIGIATIATSESNSGLQPPAVGIKVGDGTNAFNSLSWIQAIAGDVPSWAKESNHATIDNLIETAISNIPSAPSGAGTYTFTSAKLIKTVTQDAGGKITDVTYEDITIDSVSGLSTRLSDIDSSIATKLDANLASSDATINNKLIDTAAAQTKADTAESNAISVAATDATNKVGVAKTALLGTDGIEGTHTIKGAYDVASEAVNKINALDVTDTGVADKFVYEVDQTDGKIAVTRKSLTEIVGVDDTYGAYDSSSNKLATISTVTSAVDNLEAELRADISTMTSAMRFRGTVNAEPTTTTATPSDGLGAWRAGDVVLYGTAEYVVASLDSSSKPVWQLLGDEGAYQTKLSFTGVPSSTNKVVTNDTLTSNVNALEGKITSAQNVANNAKDAAEAAQADATSALNKIDALDVADSGSGFVTAVTQTDGKIAVTKKALTESDVTGLLSFDGTYNSSTNKIATKSTVTNTIEGLSSSIAATVASGNQYSVLTGITQSGGKLTAKTEVKLAAIAVTGNVNDLIQTNGDVLVLYGGTSTTVL